MALIGVLMQGILVGHYVGELTDGARKVCFYEFPDGTVAYNVGAAEQCPLTITQPIGS